MMMSAGAVFAMAAPPEGGSALVQFIPFVLVIGIFYFVILVPMQRKQKKVQVVQAQRAEIAARKEQTRQANLRKLLESDATGGELQYVSTGAARQR